MASTTIRTPKAKVPTGGGTISAKTIAGVSTNVNFDQATQDYLNQNFGSIAAWYNNPDIGPVLKAALVAGKNGTALQGEAYADFIRTHAVDANGNVVQDAANSWWNNNAKSIRDAQAQKITDPATYQAGVSGILSGSVNPTATELGIQLSPDALTKVAQDAYENGWTSTDQIKAALVSQYHYDPNNTATQGGTLGKTISDLSSIANDYGIPLPKDPAQIESFVKQIVAPGNQNPALGGNAEEIFTQYAKNQAKALYPWMSAAIDNGVSVKAYLQPYQTQIANTLDLTPDAINWQDPKWQGLINIPDPKNPGVTTQANMTQVMKTIKTDPQYGWNYTNAAKTQASDFASQLKTMFGFQG